MAEAVNGVMTLETIATWSLIQAEAKKKSNERQKGRWASPAGVPPWRYLESKQNPRTSAETCKSCDWKLPGWQRNSFIWWHKYTRAKPEAALVVLHCDANSQTNSKCEGIYHRQFSRLNTAIKRPNQKLRTLSVCVWVSGFEALQSLLVDSKEKRDETSYLFSPPSSWRRKREKVDLIISLLRPCKP